MKVKAYVNNKLLAYNVKVADKFISRLVGLLNRNSIDDNEGLLLKKCSSIHCFFMKFTIDAVYLSEDMQVLYKETIKPWRVGKIVRNSCHVLELKEGKCSEINVGEYLDFVTNK